MALCATACEDRRAYLLGIAETVVWCARLKLSPPCHIDLPLPITPPTHHFTPPVTTASLATMLVLMAMTAPLVTPLRYPGHDPRVSPGPRSSTSLRR